MTAVMNAPPPPWEGINLPKGYTLTADGMFEKKKDGQIGDQISGPVWVSAHTHDPQTGLYGVAIDWVDLKGNLAELPTPRNRLHEQGRLLVEDLACRGLQIIPGKERSLKEYLARFSSGEGPWARSTSRVGWLDSKEGQLIYVHPHPDIGVIAAHDHERVIFLPEQHIPTVHTMCPQGSLDAWKTHVAEPCRNNPFLIFSFCASLAGPLLKAAMAESGGFHFYGRSSRGKTTAAQVASSVWGCGADPSSSAEHSHVQRWNTTHNGMEAQLAAHSDGVLVLDEIHTCDAKDFERLIYNMSGGKGKTALDKHRNSRQQRTWRIVVLSTGEISAKQKIEEVGKAAHAGQLLRLLDIPTGENIIVDPHGEEPGQFALKLKRACGQHFGRAGPALIKKITEEFESEYQLSGYVRALLDDYERKLTPPKASAEQRRAIQRFALIGVAGELAASYGIVPFTQAEIFDAIRIVLRAYLTDGTNIPDGARGLVKVQDFIQRYPSSFRDANIDSHKHFELAGYISQSHEKGLLYLFTPEGFKRACGGLDCKEVLRELNRHGLLLTNEKNRLTYKDSIKVGADYKRPRLYAVRAELLEFDAMEEAVISED